MVSELMFSQPTGTSSGEKKEWQRASPVEQITQKRL